jgi:hypothetical protein
MMLNEILVTCYTDRAKHTLALVVQILPIDVSAKNSLSIVRCRPFFGNKTFILKTMLKHAFCAFTAFDAFYKSEINGSSNPLR